jgi:hypothetical protein
LDILRRPFAASHAVLAEQCGKRRNRFGRVEMAFYRICQHGHGNARPGCGLTRIGWTDAR